MADEMNIERDMPEGITRDDTVHGETYYTAADMATASAQGFRDGVASLSAVEPAAQPDSVLQLVDKLVAAESAKTRAHEKYMGKAMPEDEYVRFERLREETIPAMRAQLRDLLAPTLTQGAAIAAGAVLTDEQSHALLERMADEADKWGEGLSYEPTREQVSGWCVAFLMRDFADRTHALRIASHGQAPAAPPECKTEAERTAFAFGWFKALEQQRGQATPSPQAAQQAPAGAAVPWENFPSYLIDHCEGDTISEEGLQHALAAMLSNPQYAAPAAPSTPASPTIEGESNGK